MRFFNPVTKTEALEGIHNLDGCKLLEDDNWFFTSSEIPEGKMLDIDKQGNPILVNIQ
jgi:hypothetical protein